MKGLSLFFGVLAFVLGLTFSANAQDAAPKAIKGGILNGKAVSLPKPPYPEDAKADRVEGAVYVEVEIDEAGNVVSAVADSQPRMVKNKVAGSDEIVERELPPADPRLRIVSEAAALQARFSPTRLSGVPVRVTGTIVYNFVAVETESPVIKSSDHDVLNDKASDLPNASYPAAARAVRAQGPVNVQVTVNESGQVISADAISGHPLLRASAVSAARNAKFSPTGQSGNVVGILTYNFVLPQIVK
ncbi:MAG TPA: energy transducer TonB [Pyrinomonadaceae bacterium]|nr:energy transducer TonB [Pyrinomonadaceae bacterium]